MRLNEIKPTDVVGFLGVGLSNLSLMRKIAPLGCEIILRSDSKIDRNILSHNVKDENIYEGNRALSNIRENILILSPSVRRDRVELREAVARGVKITSDLEIFLDSVTRPIIAITGSDGKSTSTTLTHLLLKSRGIRSEMIGNIGIAMTEGLESNAEIYVAELSSFMLSYAVPRSLRAALTNLTPNHLDWHKSYDEYKKTKINLLKHSEKFVISDENSDICGAYAICSLGNFDEIKRLYEAEVYITLEDGFIKRNGDIILPIEEIRCRHRHNIKNLMTAIALTDGLVSIGDVRMVAREFCGLAHRCSLILQKDGVDYIDSSIDSTPARTVATLSSLERRVVLILGGRGKGLDYSDLSPAVKKYAEKIIICGENAEEIYSALEDKSNAQVFPDFADAIKRGIEYAKNVGVLLLSPASTSFDRFKSYAERGDKFKEIILENT